MTPSASRFNAHGMRHPNASTHHNAPVVDPVKPPEHMAADEQMVEVNSHGSSGVGVLDKATLILDCLEAGPVSLGDLVKATGLARPTAHRLAVALAHHRLVARDVQGRFMLGPRLTELASATIADELITVADPILQKLSLEADESTQLYRRQGDWRVCAATSPRPSGMHESIPVGTQLSMQAGSAAQVLLAWEDQNRIVEGLRDAHFSAAMLAAVRRIGWAQSVGERERGTASVSAPVRAPGGKVIAAVSISGPIDRMTRQPNRNYPELVVKAAQAITDGLRELAASQQAPCGESTEED